MKKDLSRGIRDRLIKALKESVKIYQGWNTPITFLGSVIITYLIFIFDKNLLWGSETMFGVAGLFFFLISNIIIFTISFLLFFLLKI